MATRVLFIQGAGSEGAHEENRKLADSLRSKLGPNYEVCYPAMPDEAHPDYEAWKRLILREASEFGGDTIFVGHSIGASVLARIFTECGSRPTATGLFLIAAPFWHDHEFWRWDEVALPADAASCYPHDVPVFLYRGDDDDFIPASHLQMYAEALPGAIVRRLPGRDHQLNNDLTEIARDIEKLEAGDDHASVA